MIDRIWYTQIAPVNSNAFKAALNAVESLNRDRRCTFLIPTKFLSPEAANAAMLIDAMLRAALRVSDEDWRTFFCSSRAEAVHAAVKLARHNAMLAGRNARDVLVIGAPPQDLLWPHLKGLDISELGFVAGSDDFIAQRLAAGMDCCAVLVLDGAEEFFKRHPQAVAAINALDAAVLLDWPTAPSPSSLIPRITDAGLSVDVTILSESLTGGAVPFGAIAANRWAFRAWNTFDTCFIHSSTYGGNRLVCTLVVNRLATAVASAPPLISPTDITGYRAAFRRYVNAGLAALYSLAGCDIDPVMANGAQLKLVDADGTALDVIDAVSGGGACPRGHCNEALLESFSTPIADDEWSLLEHELVAATGFAAAYPTVSGASSVEVALLLGLAAAPRRKIVTFANNYSGKTLLALCVTAFADMQEPFAPLYPEVEVLDPFATDTPDRFEAMQSDVGLVWFEYVRGIDGQVIPEALMAKIRSAQQAGVVVGVDEVLAGLGRTGRLLSSSVAINADIVALSKGLSDGMFPQGAVLANQRIVDVVAASEPILEKALRQRYRYPLGARIARNVLKYLVDNAQDIEATVAKNGAIIAAGLQRAKNTSSWLTDFSQTGMLVVLYYDVTDSQLDDQLAHLNEPAIVFAIMRRLIRQGVLPYFDRLIPALNLTEAQARHIARALETVFATDDSQIRSEVIAIRKQLHEI
jgi:acetylornithine/succinyldiaminopimelate/putrescine aminotransferase